MLTNIVIRNFKRFGDVEVELGNPVVLIGPNNSGKSSVLQALTLWDIGLKRWNEKRKGKGTPEKRPGVTINRRDLIAAPVPNANLLWRNLHVRDSRNIDGKQETKNIRIDIIVEGTSEGKAWQCGLEFDYANEESFYCRPLRLSEKKNPERMKVPEEAGNVKVAFLPPMSGLTSIETKLDTGAINVRIGEGRTADVLRNLCYKIYHENPLRWNDLCKSTKNLFGAKLSEPEYISERGEIIMGYSEKDVNLDLSSSGRGLQQTMLLLAYMYANSDAVLLLDEPDAHLEILRQRQIYQLLTDVASDNGNQIIAASHSEVLLNEAAGRDVVVAFVGRPHRIDNRGSQVRKALVDIGFDHYYQAEETGWVIYLEGSTDLAILRALAKNLNNDEAEEILERPFVHYVGNQPNEALRHFHGLREAVPHLRGVAIFDRLEQDLPEDPYAKIHMWRKKEIENYLCYPETFEEYARVTAEQEIAEPLFKDAQVVKQVKAMHESIEEITKALQDLGKGSPWDGNIKVSDEFLEPVFRKYFEKLSLPNIMEKKNFHELAKYVPIDKIDKEINKKLDSIVWTARSAIPAEED